MVAREISLVLGLVAAVQGFAPNKPSCASNVADAFDDLVNIANDMIGAISTCVPDPYREDLDCASTLMAIFSGIGSAGNGISAATFNCGNIDSSCAQQILGTVDDFSAFGDDVIGMVADCPSGSGGSGLYCAQAVIAGVNDLTLSAKDIEEAVELCEPVEYEPPSEEKPPEEAPAAEDAVPSLPERRQRRRLQMAELVKKAAAVKNMIRQNFQMDPLLV